LLTEEKVLEKLISWGEADSRIRAMLMTSTRARERGKTDSLSDYDIILVVTNAEEFAQNEGWISDFDTPMVQWGDEADFLGQKDYFRGVVYDNYVKIDYSIWHVSLLSKITQEPKLPDELDAGYRVLFDKEGETAHWKAPTFRAYIPLPPTEKEYSALVEEFWWSTTYVAKSLWRDEFVFGRWCLEVDIKIESLRRLLEWYIEIQRDWNHRPGVLGRGLKQALPADIWQELEQTYQGADIAGTWDDLYRLIPLFRHVAIEVGNALGYAYPQEVDDKVSAYLKVIQNLPPE
jgi:aminoglycoside 6-adenylyltransferase